MAYFEIGKDWDGDDGLGATFAPLPRAPLQLVPRRIAPVGSIVPTIFARRPAAMRVLTPSQANVIVAVRRRTIAKLRAIQAVPAAQMRPMVATLKGFMDPQAFAGFGQGHEGGVDALRALSSKLEEALGEIDGLGMSGDDQVRLGSTLLAQRAGDIAASLSIDIAWQDVVQNAGSEFARIRSDLRDLGVPWESLMSSVGFEHISAIFRDQGQSVASLRNLTESARGLYDRYGQEVMNMIVGDAGAFGEGGLRRMVEGVLGDKFLDTSASRWLTGENLQRLGGVAQAWVGAAGSGSASGYITAVGSTVAAVGVGLGAASVAVPVGTIIAAVGAVITLLASFLGDDAPPQPPEIKPCEGGTSSRWVRNPEAWTALAMWLVVKDGKFFDSDIFKEAQRRDAPVQQIIAEAGWFATIDRYSGEVMVREPGTPGIPTPMRRLLDVVNRADLLVALSDRDTSDAFERMAGQFCLEANSRFFGGKPMLWCQPHQMETFTRFFGAEQFRIRKGGVESTMPFRSDPDNANPYPWNSMIGGGIPWDHWAEKNGLWREYGRTMLMSMYLGGTVPYGVRRVNGAGGWFMQFSTGVGGTAGWRPIEMAGRNGIWLPSDDEVDPPGSLQYVNPTVPLASAEHYVPYAELPARIADQEWRLTHRIPMPSPEMQDVPADSVRRPATQRCGPPLPDGRQFCMPIFARSLASLAVFKRGEDVFKQGEKMSRGAKVALYTAGGLALAGGGYWAWRKWGRNR